MKKINKIFYILIPIFIFSLLINQTISNIDEIWSYTFARNIANGLIPYKDFNIIVTPLSCFINSILLNINNSLFTFRIITLIYYSVFVFILNKLLIKLNSKDYLRYFTILVIPFLLIRYCYLDYNILCMILFVLIIYFEICVKDNITPIIIGLIIITKQSIGAVAFILYIIYLLIKKYYYKEDISIKLIIKRLLVSLIPLLIFIIYLIITNSLNDFIDLGVLGIFTFTNKRIVFKALALLLLIIFTFVIFIVINKKDKLNLIFIISSIASLTIAYPIVDVVHVLISIVPLLVYIIYSISKFHFNIKVNILYLVIPLIIYNGYTYFNSNKIDVDVYKYLPVEKEVEDRINTLSDFIKNDNVYILDYSAGLYMLSVDRYNKYFDLFMNGNFGYYGYDNMIEILDDDVIILMNNNVVNYQEPTKVKDYVKDNFNEVGSIDRYTIYMKS